MSNRPSRLGWLTKFVVVPASVAALGYYVVGPRVGGKVAAPAQLASLRDQWVAKAEPKAPPVVTAPASSTVAMSGPAPATSSGPQVDVDVHPTINRPVIDTATEPPKPRRKKKRRKKTPTTPVESARTSTAAPATPPTVLEPVPATPPPVDPPADQGGSGGATTAGGAGI